MVRLKVYCLSKYQTWFQFQFQYGSIKRMKFWPVARPRNKFQFQYGSIKSLFKKSSLHIDYKFQFQYGSIKSRRFQIWNKRYFWFQFQYGSIKRFFANLLLIRWKSFNSNMVRLKVDGFKFEKNGIFGFNSNMVRLKDSCSRLQWKSFRVSIPIWFD